MGFFCFLGFFLGFFLNYLQLPQIIRRARGSRILEKGASQRQETKDAHTHVVKTQNQSLILIRVDDKWSNGRSEAHGCTSTVFCDITTPTFR